MKLRQDFYARDTRVVARELLGKYLVRVQDGLPLAVRLCETEAYIGRLDKACHATAAHPGPRPCLPRRGRLISTSFMVCITA